MMLRRFAAIAFLFASAAQASPIAWTVITFDEVTKEEKTFRPDDARFKFKGGAFECALGAPAAAGKYTRRVLICERSGVRSGTTLACITGEGKDVSLERQVREGLGYERPTTWHGYGGKKDELSLTVTLECR